MLFKTNSDIIGCDTECQCPAIAVAVNALSELTMAKITCRWISLLVGDEHHLLFTCPVVQHGRQQYRHLFQGRSRSVQMLTWQEDFQGVAKFVTGALESYLNLPGAVWPYLARHGSFIVLSSSSAIVAGFGCNIPSFPSFHSVAGQICPPTI
eukprot:jgi/Botrbrau1/22945/Bobra.0030s0020.1